MQFQNESNKVAIELRVEQFWSEIILVNLNRTCTGRSFNFEITHMISYVSKSILKSLVILAMGLALSNAIYSRIALSFALNRIFFSANENRTVKQNNQSDFKAFLTRRSHCRQMKDKKAIVWQIWVLNLQFQNEFNEVSIELRVEQFWSEIIVVKHVHDLRPNCTPLSSITIIDYSSMRCFVILPIYTT